MQGQPPEQNGAVEQKSAKKGGMITGWILVILGVLFLLDTFYVLDFGRFWPVILIVIGIILLVQRSKER